MIICKRSYLSILFCIAVCVGFADGQQAVVDRNAYLVGTQNRKVPPQTGFINAYQKVDSITKFFDTSSDPETSLLGVLVLTDVAVKLKTNLHIGTLDVYIQFYVPKMMANVEVSRAEFADFTAKTEREVNILIDKNHPENRAARERVLDGLQQLNGRSDDLEMTQAKNLGTIDKQEQIFSTMIASDIVTNEGTSHMLGIRSFLLVDKRVLYVDSYRRIYSEKDIDPFRDLIKAWTAVVLSANR